MKAIRKINRNRILTTLGFLFFVISLGYSQAYLADNSFTSLSSNELLAAHIDLDLKDANNNTVVLHLPAAELSYEAELETEQWMTTPFEKNLEASAVESWMTIPLSESLESNVEVEDWMRISFTESAK